MKRRHRPTEEKALATFRRHGGMLRTRDALRAGIHPQTLYMLRDAGALEQLARGLYRLSDAEPLAEPDLVTVAARIPQGVICLISALAFHELTTQIPHAVDVAIDRNAEPPRLEYPPIHVFRWSGPAFSAGIEQHGREGVQLRIYSREKTLADCFKYRHKLGLDTVLEAVRFYKEQGRIQVAPLLEFAAICRVSKVMRPYLEAIL
jgi:predicted transcriptional regulator of viral defense system